MDLFGRRLILDQLQHLVAVDDRAGRGGEVLADLERFAVGKGHQKIALIAFDIADQIFQALHQAHPVSLDGTLQRVGVGAEEVCGAEHVNDLAGEIVHPATVGGVQRFHVADRCGDRVRVHLVLLLEVVEERVRVPQRVGKTPVLGARIGGRLEFTLGQGLLRLDIMFQRLAPVADLMLHHFRRVLHHLGQIGGGGFHVDVGRRAVQRGVGLLPMGQRRREAL